MIGRIWSFFLFCICSLFSFSLFPHCGNKTIKFFLFFSPWRESTSYNLCINMEQYSAASVSGIFAVPSSEENRSHLANCDDKRLNVAISTQVRSSSPPPIPTGCRSPFVSPNHPLYVFGDRPQRPQTPPPLRVLREPPPLMGRHRPIMLAAGGPILPKPTDSLTACMESLSLAARPEPPTSPYQRLAISNAFDDGEDQQSTSTSTTTRTFAIEPQQVLPQQTQGCESGLVHLQSSDYELDLVAPW